MWVNAKCINTTARRARLPACVTELARRDQATVRAEARLRVGDPVERRFGVVAVPVGPYDRVERVALRGYPPRVADEAPELGRPDELPVLRAGGGRDRLVDQRSTEVVGAGIEQELGELRPLLHPRRLDVPQRRAQHQARQRVHLADLDARGAA